MPFFEIIGIIAIVYYAFYFIYPWFLDCDLNLSLRETFGQPIETLRGKVVWITGASSGIGEHLAYVLAKAHCKLILSARRANELGQVKEKCLKVNPHLQESDVEVMVMDICDIDNHQKCFDHVIKKFGKLDILVNNAGRSQRAVWEKIDLRVDKELFDLNVFSLVALSRIAYGYFEEIGHGHIVVTCSIAGILGVPFSGSYTGSKHALHGYFESLRTEKQNKNIPISIVCPGAIQTPFLSESFTETVGKKFGQVTPHAKNKLSPERCAHLIAVAIVNHVDECWIANCTTLQLVYLVKYYPNLARVVLELLGPAFLQRLRDNKVTMPVK
ncbi:dehydrogenase/reductase SDR family member 7 [Diachasma alloeum]|uniref:dehydrogenase/reductase SDR family member 7 n=1 Tax=Diachasma alloeum TaxID=454923 RepID=UPI0007381065|nr:dehydrogenase/reductase SDR family member 7 [Diachasma alloeum]